MPKRKKLVKKNSPKLAFRLFSIGFLLVLCSLSWNFYQTRVLSFSTPPLIFESVNIAKNPPQRIIIPKINLDLGIVESRIRNGVWEINPTGGSHLVGSASPGEVGNIILYGHNKKKLFKDTIKLKVNDQIKIISKDNSEQTYRIVETKIVNPTDVYVLSQTPDETLTFYTCTGFLDSQRFIVIAKPI